MPTYCVYLPAKALGKRSLTYSPRLIPDGFSWQAYAFGPFWCLMRRSWLALIIWLLAISVFTLSVVWLHMQFFPAAVMLQFFLIVFGLEANAMVRKSLENRDMKLVDVVVAPNREIAEWQFFNRWIKNSWDARVDITPASPSVRPPSLNPGLGLFPDSRG